VTTPIDVSSPDTAVPPAVDPVPADPTPDHRGRGSVLDTLLDDRKVVDELDYAGLAPEVVAQIAASPTVRYRVNPVAGFPGLFEFVLVNTGSGWQEKFLLQEPLTPPTGPTPLVVVFHKYGSSHGDLISSGFIPEVQSRGWYAICPLGARQKNFGNLESQINIRAALELVRALYPIDSARVYGVGFSMGGGSVVNYAARHVDPKGVMFAAVCEHTGGVSLRNTWFYEPDDADQDDNVPTPGLNLEVPDVLESLFGGTPAAQPFAYQRCSTIDFDPFTGQVGALTDFARNLEHVPTLVWMAVNDPTRYLQKQTTTFDSHIQGQNPNNTFHLAPGNVHAWTTLDPAFVCNWFAQFTLTLPRSGHALADEDGQWLEFMVEQDASGAFTPFTWSVDAPTKTITLSGTRNLRKLRIHAAPLGVALTGPVALDLSTADGTGDVVDFLYVPAAPTSVTRDGVAASASWDPQASVLTITETSAALHHWVVTFP
jgi:dienelactone hydrolase